MKKIIIATLVILLGIAAQAAFYSSESKDPVRDNVYKNAKEYADAFLSQNYKVCVSKFHPKMIKMMGGTQKAIEILTRAMPKGMEVEAIVLSYPSDTIHYKNTVQCTLVEELTLKVKQGRARSKSSILAVSEDNCKTWYFFEVNSKNINSLKKNFPFISDRVVIHKWEAPVFY